MMGGSREELKAIVKLINMMLDLFRPGVLQRPLSIRIEKMSHIEYKAVMGWKERDIVQITDHPGHIEVVLFEHKIPVLKDHLAILESLIKENKTN